MVDSVGCGKSIVSSNENASDNDKWLARRTDLYVGKMK